MAMTTERNGERNYSDRSTAERSKAVDAAILSIEKQFGTGSIMKLGSAARQQVDFIPTGSIALELARRGYSPLVLDKGPGPGAGAGRRSCWPPSGR